MSLTAAASGFVLFFLSVQVIQGQNDWGVTYTSTKICAVKGSTVEIRCTYTYPSRIKDRDTTVEKTFWFTKMNRNVHVDLSTDAEYAGRVQNHCVKNDCTLRITDLRESDSAEYKFMLITNQPGGSFTGSPGVTLSVTVPQVQVSISSPYWYPTWAELKCHSSCHPSYVWYKNGLNIHKETPYFEQYFDPADSYSCAVRGHEDFPSPSVCVLGQTCNRVTYTDRSICAIKGSSVDISCTFSSHKDRVESKFWFSPERSHQWLYQSRPEDLSEDSQYAGHVQVLETERGRSTLRITDLRESDSAEYHFKFKTPSFEWLSSLPGTTLTVTALQVQVTRIRVNQSHTEAELKCHSSCSPAGRLSYVWFKNGQKNMTEETSSYTDYFYPGDNISCAFKGREDYRSPSVYPSKFPSVSVSPSGEIVEGSSVTLTCRTDANPAANYTWYKGNQTLSLGSAGIYHFTSISSEDTGIYHCKSEDQHSVSLFIDVQYAPKLPSVSVSPSGEIVEGRSVTLTCSSDANPAANYTWYKENEDSPKAAGQIFTITDFRPEHSGYYYCEAQNARGRHNSTLHVIVVAGSWGFPVALSITAIVLVFILISVLLWIRRERSLQQQSEAGERQNNRAQTGELQYASVRFARNQADALYSNFSPAQTHRNEEEGVVYATTNFSSAPGTRHQAAMEDLSALYSRVNKSHRV